MFDNVYFEVSHPAIKNEEGYLFEGVKLSTLAFMAMWEQCSAAEDFSRLIIEALGTHLRKHDLDPEDYDDLAGVFYVDELSVDDYPLTPRSIRDGDPDSTWISEIAKLMEYLRGLQRWEESKGHALLADLSLHWDPTLTTSFESHMERYEGTFRDRATWAAYYKENWGIEPGDPLYPYRDDMDVLADHLDDTFAVIGDGDKDNLYRVHVFHC